MERDLKEVVLAMSQVLRPPFQVVQEQFDNAWLFAVNHCPVERTSDADPPLCLGEHADTIPIDELLGLYSPQRQEITIFRKGIEQVAGLLEVRPDDLRFVVRLHEWAHALFHVGLRDAERLEVARDESAWGGVVERESALWEATDHALRETIAQLITRNALTSLHASATESAARTALERITQAFETLTHRSPREYQIDDYSAVPWHRIVQAFAFLKERHLSGSMYVWKTVVTW
jgi:hypothetical protein